MDAFSEFLVSTFKDRINFDTKWKIGYEIISSEKEFVDGIGKDGKFYPLEKIDVLVCFEDFIKYLEKVEYDRRLKEKELTKLAERRARLEFRVIYHCS